VEGGDGCHIRAAEELEGQEWYEGLVQVDDIEALASQHAFHLGPQGQREGDASHRAAGGEADRALADDDEAIEARALPTGGGGNDTGIVAQTREVVGQMADVVVGPTGDGEIIRRH